MTPSNILTSAASKRVTAAALSVAQAEFETADATVDAALAAIDAINQEYEELGRRAKAAQDHLTEARALRTQATGRLIGCVSNRTGEVISTKSAAPTPPAPPADRRADGAPVNYAAEGQLIPLVQAKAAAQ